MKKERIVETNEGIQEETTTAEFDVFARHMRDRGLMDIDTIIKHGIVGGDVLEIGSGPGYYGLEWLKSAGEARLTGLEISANMIRVAQKNAAEYQFDDGSEYDYILGNAMDMPFADDQFDAVITNGSLHEWENPTMVFNEIYRVLKNGGRFLVTDLKRNISFPIQYFMKAYTKPKSMKKGFTSSLHAAYTAEEIRKIVANTQFNITEVKSDFFGLSISGQKTV